MSRTNLRTHLRHVVFRVSKSLGLFALARVLTRGDLRIFCYHGFVLDDEHCFRPPLFITRRAFEERLDLIRKAGFTMLPLGEAVQRLRDGTLPPRPVVITIDDGFYSTYSIALEILRDREVPATLYLTSYHFIKSTPVFDLIIAYMCWKSDRRTVDLSGLGVACFEGTGAQDFAPEAKPEIAARIVEYGKTALDEPGRVALARRLAERLGVDHAAIEKSRMFGLVTPAELEALMNAGLDIGLHTHRHTFPVEPDRAFAEITDNRAAVEPLTGPMDAFCYPSGEWSPAHLPLLRRSAVRSATTCDPGLATRDTEPLALPRILDGANLSPIEFEAELHGFCELIRRARGRRSPKAADAMAEQLEGAVSA